MNVFTPVLASACAAAVLLVAAPIATADVAPATTTLTATWTGTSVKLNAASTVKGTVTGGARTVALDQWLASGWHTLATTTSSSTGAYAFTVPTSSYRSAKLSVSSPATTGKAVGRTAARATTVVPSYTAAGTTTAWAPFSTAARYRLDPCRTVGYRVNLTKAPAGALADVKTAFTLIHNASGITFRYLGTTTALPPSLTGWPTDTTLVVGWAGPTQTAWSMAGKTLGMGGNVRWSTADDAKGGVRRITQGGVLLDATEKLGTGFGAGNLRGKVLLHELGHAVGLGHVSSTTQRMNPVMNAQATSRWGKGDLTGLRTLGLAGGCVTDRG